MGYPATRALADAFVRIYPDTTGFAEEAKAKIKAAMQGLGTETVKINVVADVSQAEILGLKRKMQAAGLSDFLGTDLSQGQIQNQILLIKRKLDQAKLSDFLGVNINTANLTEQIAKLKRETLTIPVVYDVGALPAVGPLGSRTITIKPVGFADAQQQITDLAHGVDLLIGWLELLDTELDRKKAAFADLSGTLFVVVGSMSAASSAANANAAATAAAGTAAFNTGRRIFGTIPLWGGLAGAAGAVTLGLHAALEGFIAIVPAAAALGITLYGMLPAAQDVYQHLLSIDTVNGSLGSNIPPLTGKFAQLQSALAPSVLELYGGGLNLINKNTGFLGTILSQVSHTLEGWIANLDVWAGHQNNLSKILEDGVAFLQQWGRVFGDLGLALANLIRADPGVAHFLLDIIQGAAKVLDVITRIPAPILTFALGLHAIYLYGGLAATALVRIAGLVPGLNSAVAAFTKLIGLGNLSSKAWLGITAGAIAIGFLVYQLSRADAATRDFISAQNQLLQQTPASQLFGQISIAIGKTVDQIQGVPVKVAAAAEAVQKNAQGFFGDLTDEAKARSFQAAWSSAVNAVSSVFRGLGLNIRASAAELQQNADITAYKNHIDDLLNSEKNLAETLVYVAKGGATTNASLAGLGKGSLTVAQSLALMDLAGVGVNDTFTVAKQKVDNLVKGYENMGVQGGILANSVNAVTFQAELQGSNVAQLTGAWDTFFGLVSGGESGLLSFEASLRTLDNQAKISTAGLGLLSAGQVTTGQNFITAAQAAQKQLDALTQLAAAAGLGTAGTDALTAATQDMVKGLLPAAKGSQTLTTILYALAQQGGYQGADSFKALSQWVANTVSPEKDLQKQTETLTVAAGNLTTDTNNLANAISGQLNAAMSQAIFIASGGQKAFDNFATSVLGAHGNIQAMIPSAISLGRELVTTTGSTTKAHQEFDVFAEGLGLTKAAADKLWQDSLPALQREINSLKGKNISITMNGQGLYTITGKIIAASQGPGGSGNAAGGLATGGLITSGSGPTADDVPVLASRGEYVVSAAAVKKYGSGTLDKLNAQKLATGGSVGGVVTNLSPFASQFYTTYNTQFQDAEIAQMKIALKAGEKAAIAAATTAVAGNYAPGLITVARYAMQHGASRAAAAGIGGVIAGESGGNPEILQSGGGGGAGLLQWTPASSAFPIQPIITGNVQRDMGVQLVDMLAYIASRGGMGAINLAGQSGGPLSAAYRFSAMEAPLVPGSDVRPDVVASLYAAGYDRGGLLPPGLSLAWNATGKGEVIAGSGTQAIEDKLDEVCDAVTGLAAMHADLMSRLIGVTANAPVGFASALTTSARAAGYRGMYTP